MPVSEAQKRANKKYQQSEAYKEYKRQYYLKKKPTSEVKEEIDNSKLSIMKFLGL